MIKCQVRFAGGDTRHDLPPSPIVTSDLRLCLHAVFIGDNLCIYGSSFGSYVFFGNNMLPLSAGRNVDDVESGVDLGDNKQCKPNQINTILIEYLATSIGHKLKCRKRVKYNLTFLSIVSELLYDL